MSLLSACTTVTFSGASTSGHPAPPAADGPASPAGTVSGATVPAATTTGPAPPRAAGCAGLTPTAYGDNVALLGATTSNGGQAWTPAADPCHAIRPVHFVPPDLGYAVFGGGQTDSTMVRLDGDVGDSPGRISS
jgi:hypothetical protein